MTSAGFVFSGQPGIWHRTVTHDDEDVVVPVDLIVPAHIAPVAGRRGARRPGGHGRSAAQKTPGVEGTLVDHDSIEVAALDTTDPRRTVVEVAGLKASDLPRAWSGVEDYPRRESSAGETFIASRHG